VYLFQKTLWKINYSGSKYLRHEIIFAKFRHAGAFITSSNFPNQEIEAMVKLLCKTSFGVKKSRNYILM